MGPTWPSAQWVQEALSPGYEANYSPSSVGEVKNVWNYTSIPPYVIIAWCIIKHKDNFTFICTCYINEISNWVIMIKVTE
jgi:hypothetical protein